MIPVGQWGAHELLPPYTKTPKPFPRKHIRMLAGPTRAAWTTWLPCRAPSR